MRSRLAQTLPKLAFLVATGFTALAVTTGALAAQTIRLGWTTADSDVDPYAIAAHTFAEELEKRAPGQFDVRFFPNHQLGDDTEMLQAMQLGTLDAGVITGTQIGNIEPAFRLNDLPFLYASNQQAHRVLDGEVGRALMDRLESRGIIGFGFAEAGFRNAINNVRPIRTAADLEGIKLRVQPADLFIASFRALGANPVPMAWSDVFTAVQQGTVDGLEIPLPVIYANKYPEITEYLSLTRHAYNALGVLMSAETFNGLSEAQREIVREAARAAIERQRETVASNNAEVLADIEEAGMSVNEVENSQAFRDRVKPVYEDYRDAIGAELVDMALEQVSE